MISKPSIFFALLLAASSAHGSGLANLEENLPTELEDAYPIPYCGREAQTAFRFERTAGSKDLFVVEPRLELGPAENMQTTIYLPFVLGSAAESEGLGQLGLSALYNFNNEGIYLPAVALAERVNFPTGPESSSGLQSHGVDPSMKLILTKTLGNGTFLQRLHVNFEWKYNTDRQPNERTDVYKFVAGLSARFGADMIGILDYVYEQELERGKSNNLLEAGLRRQITPLLTLSLGGGAGLTEDSPRFRITAGFQQSF